jgi:hypothetical protein
LGTALEPTLNDDEQDSADQQRDGNRADRFRKGKSATFQEESAHAGDGERGDDFHQVITSGRVAPTGRELAQSFGEQGRTASTAPDWMTMLKRSLRESNQRCAMRR